MSRGASKTNDEKFMHSLSGRRARSREFPWISNAGWVRSECKGWGVGETALSPRLRPHAEYAKAYEGDCA